ncbi:hypothetical protein Taro_048208 [Colocasia esculenta]|uniref:Uncharacterized protein n=1 Tax=Colocasia esculenta TaxID=4460 RepID=A0A843X7A1_COLES|nr:hypothetical protein [Colocasia esculenta]
MQPHRPTEVGAGLHQPGLSLITLPQALELVPEVARVSARIPTACNGHEARPCEIPSPQGWEV